jgi:hypothetical protein
MVIGRKIDRELGIEKIARVKIRVPPGKFIPIHRGVPGDGCRRWWRAPESARDPGIPELAL